MKKIFTLISVLFCTLISYSQVNTPKEAVTQNQTLGVDPIDPDDPTNPPIIPAEVGKTNGELSVSLTGASVYNIPLLMPKGINGVEPKVGLTYNSQSGFGLAGLCWNLSGLSSITRIATTKFHDGFIDPVDFDNNDRFALDGQRLILKSGTYGAIGSTYELGSFSNTKISLISVNGLSAFKVEYVDGAVAFYGVDSNSNSNIVFGISYWENLQGVRISYEYEKNNNYIYVTKIKYGSRGTSIPINVVNFVYKTKMSAEEYYIGGLKIINNKILSSIKIVSNNVGFRNYYLDYGTTVASYEKLLKVEEKSGDETKSLAPLVFQYSETSDTYALDNSNKASLNISSLAPGYSLDLLLSADINEDGIIDIIKHPRFDQSNNTLKDKYLIYKNLNSNPASLNTGIAKDITGRLNNLFQVNYLKNNSGVTELKNSSGWCEVTTDPNTNKTYFRIYSIDENLPGKIKLENTIEYTFPKSCFYRGAYSVTDSQGTTNYPGGNFNATSNKRYLSGDFNGDKISDLVLIELGSTNLDVESQICAPGNSDSFIPGDTYFVDFDSRILTGNVKFSGKINIDRKNYDTTASDDVNSDANYACRTYAIEFDGDSKTDLLVIKNGVFDVYTLNDTNLLTKVFTQTLPTTYLGNNFYPGDFNGDGKTDLLTLFNGGHSILYNTGSGFEVKNSTLVLDNARIMDFDNDGKSDVCTLKVSNDKIEIWFLKSINNVITSMNRNTPLVISTTATNVNSFIVSDLTDSKRPILGFLTDNILIRVNYFKDYGKEKLLRTIYDGHGIENRIQYLPFFSDNYLLMKGEPVTYPNFNFDNIGSFQVVSNLSKFSANNSTQQDYRYYGPVCNVEGLGFLGFRSLVKTNWYNDPSFVVSNVIKHDINKRGAQVDNFTVLGWVSPNFALNAGSSYVNRTETIYNNEDTSYQNPLLPNKVFKLNITKQKQTNGLEGTSKETTFTYNANSNPQEITTVLKRGGTSEKSITEIYEYKPVNNSPFLLDIPSKKNKTLTILPSNETSSIEELYTYDSNLLTQIEKKGDNTVSLTEINQYDSFGNIIQKTLSAPGLASRISNFEYDTSGRFLTKKTDIEGLITDYTYNPDKGYLLTESLPSTTSSNLKNTYTYDVWGKVLSFKNIYNKTKTYSYSNLNGGGILKTVTADDLSSEKITFNELGNEIKNEKKDINGNWSVVDTEYDIENRVIKKTQPYNSTPNVWNEMQYDEYGRLSQSVALKSTSSQGKITNYYYSGTTTTENDGVKSKVTLKNSYDKVITMTETPGGVINYEYYPNGNLKSTNYNGVTTSLTQDGWGRKTGINDPSAGIRKYEYNHFGELTREVIDGKADTNYNLNDQGKILDITVKDISGNLKSKKTYTYNNTSKLIERIKLDDSVNATFVQNDYTYDTYNKLLSVKELLSGKAEFIKTFTYDDFGRPLTETYSSENKADTKKLTRTVTNYYKNGYKWKIIDNDSPIVPLWEIKTINAQGSVLTASLGNGVAIANTFDIYGFPTQNKHDKASTNIMTLTNTFDPVTGNLKTRSHNMFGAWSETLSYDQADRLTAYKDVTGSQTQSYNDNGTIAKNNLGDHAYGVSGKPFQVSSVTPVDQSATSSVLNYYQTRTQDIAYTLFDSPLSIKEATKENIDFEYNISDGRSVMYYGSLDADKSARAYRKYYSADGTMEIKIKTTTPTSIEFTTYIGGDGYSAPAVLKSDGVTPKMHYLHRDYQGTIVGVTDASGVIVEKRLFDVWGKLIKYQKGAVTTIPVITGTMLVDRGYTGHEHLLGVDLINMNGRIYDYNFHRFLQPDNNIQDPFNTQNYNRYAYVMNNPTKYTDPSGEFWELLAGFVFSMYVHGAQATGDPNPMNWDAGNYVNAALGAGSLYGSQQLTDVSNKLIESSWKKQNFEAIPYTNTNLTHQELNYDTFVTNLNQPAAYNNGAFSTAGSVSVFLLADDATGFGVADDVAIPFIWAGAGLIWTWQNKAALKESLGRGVDDIRDYVGKMNREIDRISEKLAGPPGFVYELQATKSDYYPNYNTGGTTYLNVGDVWKYGQTTQGMNRYPDAKIDLVRMGLEMVPIYYGTQRDILIYEKYMIYGYFFTHGSRPPGNSIFR